MLTAERVASDPPVGLGGTLVDGIYFSTARIQYTGVGGATGPIGSTEQRALRISHGGTVFLLSQAVGGVAQPNNGAFLELVADGGTPTEMKESLVCPAVTSVTFPYIATPTTFTIIAPTGANTHVYTKQ